jgi:hypothetical protein
MIAAPRYAKAILDVVTADLRYRDAIRGDLDEEFARRAADKGIGRARRWYVGETIRTSTSLLRHAHIAPAAGARILSAVFAAYMAVLGADRLVTFVIWRERASLAPVAGRLAALSCLVFAGATAGWSVARVTRRPPLIGAIAFLALALGIGTRHIFLAQPHEVWYRAVKVALLVGAAAVGAARCEIVARTR